MEEARRTSLKALAAAAMGQVWPATNAQPTADWLVLVYMNGKNDLCRDALDDFGEMAAVGSTAQVSIVVQLGRPASQYNPPTFGGWSGVKRFHVTHGMTPTASNALVHVGKAHDKAGDMGDPATLDDFVTWATKTFPTRNRLLVIWNHGRGWRFIRAAPEMKAASPAPGKAGVLNTALANVPAPGTYRSVSNDDDHHSVLYNKQIQTVLEKQSTNGIRFNIVAYDACLMAMVETVYSLRTATDFVVGSQELEPGSGWEHSILLKKIVATPSITPEDYARTIVESYKEKYGNFDMTTLSAVRVAGIQSVSQAISGAAKALIASKATSYPELRAVRSGLAAFADYYGLGFAIDCETLFVRLAEKSAVAEVRKEAQAVVAAMKKIVIANYASTETAKYSPLGLALYFPETRKDFDRDTDRQGYLRSNQFHPVDFVRDADWSLLLRDYLGLPA